MLKVDGSLDHIPAKRAHVVSLYESINQPLVNIPGYGAAPTGAFILGTRNDHGAFTVFVYLYQPQTQAVLVYVSEPRSLTAEQLRKEETEAVRFVESMGFMVDDVQFTQLVAADQEAVMERVPMFRPLPAPVVEGRPASDSRFGALGGVVTGRPESEPTSEPRGHPVESTPNLPSGLPPVSSGPVGSPRPSGIAPGGLLTGGGGEPARLQAPESNASTSPSPRQSPVPLLNESGPPPPHEGSAASLGRGLALSVGGNDGKRPSSGPTPDALNRIGRLLGTFSILLGLVLGGSLSACATTRKDTSRAQEATLELGNQELARSNWAEALRHYQVVLSENDDNEDAHRGAGLAFWRLGRLDDAELHLRRAVTLRADWSEPKNELAVILVERGSCNEAQTLLKQVLEDVFYPTHHFAEHNLARAEACAGGHREAIGRLERLTEKRPKFCLAYLTASEVASSAKLHEATVEACESFRENCERDDDIGPKIPEALKATCDLRKGMAYAALGDVESARTALERCRAAKDTRAACRDALDLLPP